MRRESARRVGAARTPLWVMALRCRAHRTPQTFPSYLRDSAFGIASRSTVAETRDIPASFRPPSSYEPKPRARSIPANGPHVYPSQRIARRSVSECVIAFPSRVFGKSGAIAGIGAIPECHLNRRANPADRAPHPSHLQKRTRQGAHAHAPAVQPRSRARPAHLVSPPAPR